jgi:hypothetical protein
VPDKTLHVSIFVSSTSSDHGCATDEAIIVAGFLVMVVGDEIANDIYFFWVGVGIESGVIIVPSGICT